MLYNLLYLCPFIVLWLESSACVTVCSRQLPLWSRLKSVRDASPNQASPDFVPYVDDVADSKDV